MFLGSEDEKSEEKVFLYRFFARIFLTRNKADFCIRNGICLSLPIKLHGKISSF